MTKYYCRAGRHDFKPNKWRQFVPMQYRGFEFSFMLDRSCWFADDLPGRYQQNKVCGITGAFSKNNSRAALISWQLTDAQDMFIATGYVNHPDTSFDFRKPGVVFSAGQEVWGKCLIRERAPTAAEILLNPLLQPYEAYYEIQAEGMSVPAMFSLSFSPAWHGFYREAGPWFGGRLAAPQGMSLEMSLIRR